MSLQLTQSNFRQHVLQNSQPVLVDFWASWCPPCRALGPIIDEIATELDGHATVGKLNVDEQAAVAEEYGITSLPTVLIFRDGNVVESFVGVQDKQVYVEALKRAENLVR